MTDESHSSARILDVRPFAVREELNRGRIVVLAGFQGVNPVTKKSPRWAGGKRYHCGRHGRVLKAECCEIIKEVDGVCRPSPRIVRIQNPCVSWILHRWSEMCFWGAKVLHFVGGTGTKPKCAFGLRKWAALNTARK